MRATGWSRRKASDIVTGEQRYNRDIINDAARALNLNPFELLLHPADAMAMRQLRQGGVSLASDNRSNFQDFPLALVVDATARPSSASK